MKFLLDVNSSGAVRSFLAALGHDVVDVAARDPSLSDVEIISWAVSEGRIVVTTDKDFSELVFLRSMRHSGLLRLENLPRARRLALLTRVLEEHEPALERGAMIIADERHIRVRLPSA